MPRALRLGVYKITHKMIKAYDLERQVLGHCPIDHYTGNPTWECRTAQNPCRLWASLTNHGGCAWRFIEHYIVLPDVERDEEYRKPKGGESHAEAGRED